MRKALWLATAMGASICVGPAALGSSAGQASSRTVPPPPLAAASLAPALKAAADRDHVLLFNMDVAGETPLEGDSTVAWVGGSDAKGKRQWLIQFRRGVATPAERAAGHGRDKTKYLSWGPVVSFKSDVEALDIWIAGPVSVGGEDKPMAVAPVKRIRLLVPSDYLRLGLDNSLRVDEHMRKRVQALRKEDPKFVTGHIYVLEKPIKPENIRYAKPVAAKIEFTPEMERAWVGGYVALEAFYDLANDVPEIKEIASIALERPSVFKLAKLATGTMFKVFFGGPQTRPVDPAKLGLVPVFTESFDSQFSFSFGEDPIVTGVMVVTKPLPPLDTTAGILGFTAVHPKDATRQVQVGIISGVRGAIASKPTPRSGGTAQAR